MTDFIYNPNSVFSSDQNFTNKESVEYFTIIGLEDHTDTDGYPRVREENEEKIFAKKSSRKDGTPKYSIRLSNNGKLYNPVSIYGKETELKFLDRICRSDKKFKEVNEKTFLWYMKFLSTKNISWLYNAEREME